MVLDQWFKVGDVVVVNFKGDQLRGINKCDSFDGNDVLVLNF